MTTPVAHSFSGTAVLDYIEGRTIWSGQISFNFYDTGNSAEVAAFNAALPSFINTNNTGITGWEVRVEDALEAWQLVSMIDYLIDTSNLSATYMVGDQHTTINQGDVLGYGGFPGGNNYALAFETSSAYTPVSAEAGAASGRDWLVLHEIGHVLGLAHPQTAGNGTPTTSNTTLYNTIYTVMAYNHGPSGLADSSRFGMPVTPMALDIAAVQAMYGARPAYTGVNTYEILSSGAAIDTSGADGLVGVRRAYYAIWDSGGADTIKYAGTEGVLVNLNAATLVTTAYTGTLHDVMDDVANHSTIFQGLSQTTKDQQSDPGITAGGFISSAITGSKLIDGGYTIANSVVIEKVETGKGKDLVIGNDADNSIKSGEGDDNLFGGAGADTLQGEKGKDYLSGGEGKDSLSGGVENDTLMGGQGHDLLAAQGGSDSLSGDAGDDLIDIRSADAKATDIISIKLAAGGGHDYLVFSPDDSHTPKIKVLLTDFAINQVTFLSDQVVKPHTPQDDEWFSEGELVIKLPDGTSLFLGALHGTSIVPGSATSTGRFTGDANIEFVFSGGVTRELDSIFTGSGGSVTLQVGALDSAHKAAPSNWPNVNLPPATPPTNSVSLTGGASDSVLYGGNADDVLAAGPSNDQLLGGKGDDEYRWQRGNGNVAVQDNARDSGDVLELTGVATSAVSLSRVDDDVVMTIAPTTPGGADGGEIKLQDLFFGVDDVGVDSVVFSNTTWTADHIRQVILTTPTAGPDTLQGSEDPDTLSGGGGNDWLDGGAGNDLFMWARGDGNDAIDDWGGDDGDRLALDGVSAASVRLQAISPYDAILVIEPSSQGGSDGGTIEMRGVLAHGNDGVDEIGFSGSVVWSRADFLTHLQVAPGTAGADNIYGGPGDDTLSGLGDVDTVSGGGGNDTIIWSRGDGDDLLSDDGYDQADRLVLHGVLPADVTLSGQEGNVVLVIAPSGAGAGGTITLVDSAGDFGGNGFEEVHFDNTAVWTKADFQARVLAASQTPGNDTIQGFGGSETITGGTGDDLIDGGLGDDVFRWSAGDGDDVLTEGQDCGDDRLELLGVSPGDVIVEQVGDDIHLIIDQAGGPATWILVNQALWDDGYGIESIVLDGQTWTAEDLMDQLAGA